jgi:hypothetical protein
VTAFLEREKPFLFENLSAKHVSSYAFRRENGKQKATSVVIQLSNNGGCRTLLAHFTPEGVTLARLVRFCNKKKY